MGKLVNFDPTNIDLQSLRILRAFVDDFNFGESDRLEILPTVLEGLNREKKLSRVVIFVRIGKEGENPDSFRTVGEFRIEFIFHVADLEEWLKVNAETDRPAMNDLLVGTLRGIAYSTARGIIYSQCMGTALSGLVLPVVDALGFEIEPSA